MTPLEIAVTVGAVVLWIGLFVLGWSLGKMASFNDELRENAAQHPLEREKLP